MKKFKVYYETKDGNVKIAEVTATSSRSAIQQVKDYEDFERYIMCNDVTPQIDLTRVEQALSDAEFTADEIAYIISNL